MRHLTLTSEQLEDLLRLLFADHQNRVDFTKLVGVLRHLLGHGTDQYVRAVNLVDVLKS